MRHFPSATAIAPVLAILEMIEELRDDVKDLLVGPGRSASRFGGFFGGLAVLADQVHPLGNAGAFAVRRRRPWGGWDTVLTDATG